MNNNLSNPNLLLAFAEFLKKNNRGLKNKALAKKQRSSNTVTQRAVYKHLTGFLLQKPEFEVLPIVKGKSQRELKSAGKYWQRFGQAYTKYLQGQNFAVNYIGLHVKVLRTFLTWYQTQRNLNLGDFKSHLQPVKEETPIITLSQSHLFKLMDVEFLESLPLHLNKTARLFLFGCTVGLRYSDLVSLTARNIENRDGAVYLVQRSQKTDTLTRIKLPGYAIQIIESFGKHGKKLLPFPSKNQFNQNLKKLGELAGWTEDTGKLRLRNGKKVELKTKRGKKYRFCDLLSSHVMRKTAITTLLMNGMPEHMVRRISGHTANSVEFFRYVKYSQSFLDEHTDAIFEKLTKHQ